MNELPELTNKVDLHIGIDATPDGNYALRILRIYRSMCDSRWEVSGLSKERTAVYDYMNELQPKRAAELDKAIKALEESQE